jgi:hypothetical protein
MDNNRKFQLIFIGLSEGVREYTGLPPYPIGPIDIHKLSMEKVSLIYPLNLKNYVWVFLVNEELLDDPEEVSIIVRSDDGSEVGTATLRGVNHEVVNREGLHAPDGPMSADQRIQDGPILYPRNSRWGLLHVSFQWLLKFPSTVYIYASAAEREETIGAVTFGYQKSPSLSTDYLEAIKSNPHSLKFVRTEMACQNCSGRLRAYSGTERNVELERQGYVWQHELDEYFHCSCGTTSLPLKYLKENLHSLIGLDPKLLQVPSIQNYERLYAYSEIDKIVQGFRKLIQQSSDEDPIHEFIRKNPVMLAAFQCRKLFNKPSILGKHQPDFVILNTRRELLLIELEKPSLKLFKKNGHPTADLNHAYEQVRDWKHEYAKYPTAVLEGLKLKPDEVMTVKGVVIAGRSSKPEHMKRHLSLPPYNDVEFLTFDDLATSLLQISRDLT